MNVKKRWAVPRKQTLGKSHERVLGSLSKNERKHMAKVTRPKAAKAASKVLRDGRSGKASKTAAGSALSQVPGKRSVKRGKK